MLNFISKISKLIWVVILLVILFPKTKYEWKEFGLVFGVAASGLLLLLLGIHNI